MNFKAWINNLSIIEASQLAIGNFVIEVNPTLDKFVYLARRVARGFIDGAGNVYLWPQSFMTHDKACSMINAQLAQNGTAAIQMIATFTADVYQGKIEVRLSRWGDTTKGSLQRSILNSKNYQNMVKGLGYDPLQMPVQVKPNLSWIDKWVDPDANPFGPASKEANPFANRRFAYPKIGD